jgi:PIN domain nuclease of toxin-antitoxin system
MILLDTHALVWMDEDSPRLGRQARKLIDKAFREDKATVSVISFWECAMLAGKNRLRLPSPVDTWRSELLANGLHELPLDGQTAILAVQLTSANKDPADRFIAATALRHRATLVTADERLLAGLPGLTFQDARK